MEEDGEEVEWRESGRSGMKRRLALEEGGKKNPLSLQFLSRPPGDSGGSADALSHLHAAPHLTCQSDATSWEKQRRRREARLWTSAPWWPSSATAAAAERLHVPIALHFSSSEDGDLVNPNSHTQTHTHTHTHAHTHAHAQIQTASVETHSITNSRRVFFGNV